ncbi:DUF7343 domain-containing protein (plasmid) [Haloferacaceae archaeon DSL9]
MSALVAALLISASIFAGATAAVAASTGTVGITQETGVENASSSPSIHAVTHSGLGVIRVDGTDVYSFADEPQTIKIVYSDYSPSNVTEVCLTAQHESESHHVDFGCSITQSDEDFNAFLTATFDIDEWPSNETGTYVLTATVTGDPLGSEETVQTETTIHVLSKSDDHSASGLSNEDELLYGTDFTDADTDGDGLSDGSEINTYGTDPLSRDTSGNGISDGMEVLIGTNPTNPLTPPIFIVVLAFPIGIGVLLARILTPSSNDQPAQSGSGAPTPDLAGSAPQQPRPGNSGSAEPAIITDEDRVIRLLRQNGGRVPQREIVASTEWSKSKVSRLLSRMEEDGHLTKVTLGRENLIVLGDEVGDTQPSFES